MSRSPSFVEMLSSGYDIYQDDRNKGLMLLVFVTSFLAFLAWAFLVKSRSWPEETWWRTTTIFVSGPIRTRDVFYLKVSWDHRCAMFALSYRFQYDTFGIIWCFDLWSNCTWTKGTMLTIDWYMFQFHCWLFNRPFKDGLKRNKSWYVLIHLLLWFPDSNYA